MKKFLHYHKRGLFMAYVATAPTEYLADELAEFAKA